MTFNPLEELRAVLGLRGAPDRREDRAVRPHLARRPLRVAPSTSFERLAEETGLSPRWVKTAVHKLAKAGRISVTRRRVEGRTTSNLYQVHSLHTGVISLHSVLSDLTSPPGVISLHGGGDLTAQELLTELHPEELPSFALARPEGDPERASKGKKKPKKGPKHTPEEIAAKDLVVAAFVEGVQSAKGITPKLTHCRRPRRGVRALAKAYPEEACALVRRALADPFVRDSNCTLRYIAGKADTWRGTAPAKAPGRHMVQPGPADGGTPGWKLREEARRRAAGEQ